MNLKLNYFPKQNQETCIRQSKAVTYITFPALDAFSEHVVNAFSTRLGGVSTGIHQSMNLDFANGDDPEKVRQNYRIFSDAVGIPYQRIVLSNQKHTTNLRIATAKDCGKGLEKERDYDAVDGLMTNEPNICLSLCYADCVPIYLYDPKQQAIALLHSGWKGTQGQIGQKALAKMQETYGTDPADVIACIAPSICSECYEVSEDLYQAFKEAYSAEEMECIFLPGKDAQHFQLDMWKAISITLEKAGITKEHLHVTDLCTCHNPDLLFSHRYTKGKRGNVAAFFMLKE